MISQNIAWKTRKPQLWNLWFSVISCSRNCEIFQAGRFRKVRATQKTNRKTLHRQHSTNITWQSWYHPSKLQNPFSFPSMSFNHFQSTFTFCHRRLARLPSSYPSLRWHLRYPYLHHVPDDGAVVGDRTSLVIELVWREKWCWTSSLIFCGGLLDEFLCLSGCMIHLISMHSTTSFRTNTNSVIFWFVSTFDLKSCKMKTTTPPRMLHSQLGCPWIHVLRDLWVAQPTRHINLELVSIYISR